MIRKKEAGRSRDRGIRRRVKLVLWWKARERDPRFVTKLDKEGE